MFHKNVSYVTVEQIRMFTLFSIQELWDMFILFGISRSEDNLKSINNSASVHIHNAQTKGTV